MKKHLIAIFTSICSSVALADVTLVYKGEQGARYVSYVAEGMVRIDGDPGKYMVYDSVSESLRVVDGENKTYSDMDAASMRDMAAKVSGVKAQLEGVMAGMSPEQRAQLERFGLKPQAASAAIDVRQTSKHEKIKGWTCAVKQFVRNSQPVGEVCMADGRALGVSRQDLQSLIKLQKLAADMAGSLGQAGEFAAIANAWTDVDDIPVLMSFTEGGKTYKRTLEKLSSSPVDAKVFLVPQGFQKRESPLAIGQ